MRNVRLRLTIGVLAGLLWSAKGGAQNLVPNGSFEEYTICPPSFGYAQYATGWENPYCGSADYFNACAETPLCGVPGNAMAFQNAASGLAYMGMWTYLESDPYYREVVGADLIEPLSIGIPVYVTFKACAGGDGNDPLNTARYASRGIGVRFVFGFPPSYQDYRETFLDKPPAVYLTDVLGDSVNWQLVSGVYIPDSAYTKVMIGNFLQDSLSGVIPFTEGELLGAYSLVDDLCISTDPAYCPQALAVGGIEGAETLRVYPVPFADQLNISSEGDKVQLRSAMLRDALGRVVIRSNGEQRVSSLSLDTQQLSSGAYLLSVELASGSKFERTVIRLNP